MTQPPQAAKWENQQISDKIHETKPDDDNKKEEEDQISITGDIPEESSSPFQKKLLKIYSGGSQGAYLNASSDLNNKRCSIDIN